MVRWNNEKDRINFCLVWNLRSISGTLPQNWPNCAILCLIKLFFFEASPSSLGWKSNFERLLAVKRYPQPGSFRELKAIEKTITKVQRAFAKKCCYWYAYIAIESLKLSSHNGKTWKGIVAGHWITSSPTVPSSLLGMLQVTFPCFREIWNLVEFSSTAQEKCMMYFSLQE